MQPWARWVLVASVAVGAIGLATLGIREFQELLEIGIAPPEILHRKVPVTTVSLFPGLVMLLWAILVGIHWARSPHGPEEEREHPPAS
ncbi:MAG: hypothetical protein ACREI5_07125 [Candidatus Methylomirabilales bacterium]